jgi:DNA-binding MarR family transcriptional regulator
MNGDAPPKSRLELVMEKLRKQDEEQGITQVTLTDAQREAIAEAKRQHEARVAQRRIMHQGAIAGSFDPMAELEREAELKRDLDRFEREHEEKLARIRRGDA